MATKGLAILGKKSIGFGEGKKQADSIEKTNKQFKTPVGNHIVEHMEMFAKCYPPKIIAKAGGNPTPSPLTALDMAYYSVYGDYRLMESGLEYITHSIPIGAAHPNSFHEHGPGTGYHPFYEHITQSRQQLSGVNEGSPGHAYHFTNIEWFNSELVNGDSGQRFSLPSLGTIAVREHAFRDISKEQKRDQEDKNSDLVLAMSAECSQLAEFYRTQIASDDMGNSANPAGTLLDGRYGTIGMAAPAAACILANLNPAIGVGMTIPEVQEIKDMYQDEDISPVVYILGQAMKEIGMDQDRVNEAVRIAYYQRDDDRATPNRASGAFESSKDIANSFFKALFRPRGLQQDTIVKIRDTAAGNLHTDALEIDFLADQNVVVDVDSLYFLDQENAGGLWDLTLIDPHDHEETYPVNKVTQNQGHGDHSVPDNLLVGATHEKYPSGRPTVTKASSEEILFQCRAVDTYFSIVTIMYMYAKMKNYAYLSPGVNHTNKPKLARDSYSNMVDPIDPGMSMNHNKMLVTPDTTEGRKKKLKTEESFLRQLLPIRLYITAGGIVNERVRVSDRKAVDDFYSGDILMREVAWLTQALVDTGSVVYEKEAETDLMAQLQYKAIPTSGSVTQFAEAPRETVFYQVDAPLLRDVIFQYTREYNYFVVRSARIYDQAGKKPKKYQKKLLKAYWGSLTSQAGVLLKGDDALPHKLFSRLFTEVSNVETGGFGSDFPPSWVGTNNVARLTSDPAKTGTTIEKKFYEDRLKEYVEYIRDRYRDNDTLAADMLSVMESFKLETIEDVEDMRQAFIKRLEGDAKKDTLLDTGSVFRAYSTIISILRATIAVPLQERREFIAKGIDDRMVKDIQSRMQTYTSAVDTEPILPRSHSQYQEPIGGVVYDPESGLSRANNPNDLPMPKFYPEDQDELRLDVVRQLLANIDEFIMATPDDAIAEKLATILKGIDLTRAPGDDGYVTIVASEIYWRDIANPVWDSRASTNQPPSLLHMTEHRMTFGIPLWCEAQIEGETYEFTLDLIPYVKSPGTKSVDFSDYSSVFFSKEAWERPGEPWVYPNPARSTQRWDKIGIGKMSIFVSPSGTSIPGIPPLPDVLVSPVDKLDDLIVAPHHGGTTLLDIQNSFPAP